jgi:hypothetical protein
MEYLTNECHLSNVIVTIPLETASGKESMKSFFEILPKFRSIVYRRTNTILDMKPFTTDTEIKKNWQTVKMCETQLEPYLSSKNELAEQAESEIYFTNKHLTFLNSVPFVLTILLFMKIWVAPIMGLLMPIMVFIAPYIIIKFIMGMQIPWEVYTTIIMDMTLGIKKGQTIGLKQLSQILYFLTSFGQGMVQPVLTSIQTSKSDVKMKEIGQNVIAYIQSTSYLYKRLLPTAKTTIPPLTTTTDPRIAYWWFRENQTLFKCWMRQVGCMDVYWSLACDSRWTPVSWSQNGELILNGLADLCISQTPVYSDLNITSHSLLTGPNRGGKSSSLRAILQQVLFARVFGITSCKDATIPWYDWIHSRIRSLDVPGQASLFEEDVKSAAKVLARSKTNTLGLVIIDELFHSTNPPDALFCAKTFLEQFWKSPSVTSIISTHSFELLNTVPKSVSLLCCPATQTETSIKYSYRLEPGVCTLSSVREVLTEAGFSVA